MARYAWSYTKRLVQLTGDYDPDPNGLTLTPGMGPHVNFTGRWGGRGVDLGANVEHRGQLFIFFGDVPQSSNAPPPAPHDADLVAYADIGDSAARIVLTPVLAGETFAPFAVAGDDDARAAGDLATLVVGRQQHVF